MLKKSQQIAQWISGEKLILIFKQYELCIR